MLNPAMGVAETIGGEPRVRVPVGTRGHVLFGPYEQRAAGRYLILFTVTLAAPAKPLRRPAVILDVTRDAGCEVLARREIGYAELARSGDGTFAVELALDEPAQLEYRVWTGGYAPLLVHPQPRAVAITPWSGDRATMIARAGFPGREGEAVPFFAAHRPALAALHAQGVGVAIEQGGVVLTVDGISLHAARVDDLTFIGEVFFDNTYRIALGRRATVIDIGMNIGLTALQFASRPQVRVVHAFEPFAETFERARANLALNPALAAKIVAHNAGLSDADHDGAVLAPVGVDSGAMTVTGVSDGVAVDVALRDAGRLLAPIVAEAEARGEAVIVKVDCEGSEYAVFRALGRAGLLPRIHAFLVEWHAMFERIDRHALIDPLERAGFLVFDRAPPAGNGFFYAARLG